MEKKLTPEQVKTVTELNDMIEVAWRCLPRGDIKFLYKEEILLAGYTGLCRGVQCCDTSKYDLKAYCFKCIKHAMQAELRKWLANKQLQILDIDRPITSKKTGDQILVSEVLADKTQDVETSAIRKEQTKELFQIIYKVCNKQEIKILKLYLYLECSEIAETLNLSRQRIYQIISNAREKILQEYREAER